MKKIDEILLKTDKAINSVIVFIQNIDYRWVLLAAVFAAGVGVGLLF